MKKLFMILLLLMVAAPAMAQVNWGVRGGVYVNGDTEPMVGVEMMMPFRYGFTLNPNIEFSPGDPDIVTVNGDLQYNFNLGTTTRLWLGGGLALMHADDFDAGVNLMAGVGAQGVRWYPYVQIKRVIPADFAAFNSIAVGIRF